MEITTPEKSALLIKEWASPTVNVLHPWMAMENEEARKTLNASVMLLVNDKLTNLEKITLDWLKFKGGKPETVSVLCNHSAVYIRPDIISFSSGRGLMLAVCEEDLNRWWIIKDRQIASVAYRVKSIKTRKDFLMFADFLNIEVKN